MKAKAVALKPPAISRTTPRSHVARETISRTSASSFDICNARLTGHCREDNDNGNDHMSVLRERFFLEKIIFYNFSTHVVLKGD